MLGETYIPPANIPPVGQLSILIREERIVLARHRIPPYMECLCILSFLERNSTGLLEVILPRIDAADLVIIQVRICRTLHVNDRKHPVPVRISYAS